MKKLDIKERIINIYKSGGVIFKLSGCRFFDIKRFPARTIVQEIAFLVSIFLLIPMLASCSEEEPTPVEDSFAGEISDWEEQSGTLTKEEE